MPDIVLNILFLLLLSPNNEIGVVIYHFTDEEIKKDLQAAAGLTDIPCGRLEFESTANEL